MTSHERSHTIGKDEILSSGRRRLISRYVMERLLNSLRYGRISVTTPSGQRFERAGVNGPSASITLHNWRPMMGMLFGGDIGFAKSYIEGDWSTHDLASLIELGARNSDSWGRRVSAWAPMRAVNRIRHWRRANTKKRSRDNIEFHYDLGNEFYAAWLDRSMTYSSALYSSPNQTLESAQKEKLDLIIESLSLKGGEEILEIGSGWGGFAEKAASENVCSVTGLTLSPSQLEFSRQRIAKAGLSQKVQFDLRDYRDAAGQYDRIVSIEMLEAVGEEFWPAYFRTIHERLKPGGSAVIQVITIADDRFDSYRTEVDFIQRYVFPGGMLPSDLVLREQVARAGFEIERIRQFGRSYALTLAEWRRRFDAAWHTLEKIGFDDRFRRLWEYYLAYCEAGFRAGTIDVGIYLLRPKT